jgi:hypothetical protein
MYNKDLQLCYTYPQHDCLFSCLEQILTTRHTHCSTVYCLGQILTLLDCSIPYRLLFRTDSEQADTAYGVFCLFNMIIYFVYAIILTVHRRSVIAPVVPQSSSNYKVDNAHIVNPDMERGEVSSLYLNKRNHEIMFRAPSH